MVFDLDGVVADSEPLHVRSWVQVLASLGVGLEQIGEPGPAAWVGVPDVEIVAGLVERLGLPLGAGELLDRKREVYRALVPEALRAFPGVREELASWDGVPLGMATATPRREAELMLATLGLSSVFRVLVTRDEVRRTKPAPDCYLLAASGLGLDPSRCAAVEDAPYGVQAAREAGMHVLGVTTSYPAKSLGQAHRLFTTVPRAICWLKARVT